MFCFTHSSADGRLDCFRFFIDMNNTAMNIHARASVRTHVFVSVEVLYHMVTLGFTF